MTDDAAATRAGSDHEVLDRQREYWCGSYEPGVERLGAEANEPAEIAAALFAAEGKRDLLELGAGQGRDTLHFACTGLRVHALDYADSAVEALRAKAVAAGLSDEVSVSRHDACASGFRSRTRASMPVTRTCCSRWRSSKRGRCRAACSGRRCAGRSSPVCMPVAGIPRQA